MKKDIDKNTLHNDGEAKDLPGYPLYPASDDIFARAEHITSKNAEGLNDIDNEIDDEDDDDLEELDFEDGENDDDLDIPGADLDDDEEAIGSEDEENNYYSIGGDEHNDLDEDDVDLQ